MRCIACDAEEISERAERTAQGYRRFRCHACGKQFNERSGGILDRTQYPSDVIALVVFWRLRYKVERFTFAGAAHRPSRRDSTAGIRASERKTS